MSKRSREVTEEKDFQTIADEHGANAVEWIREEVEALEHARECSGDCDDCRGGEIDGEPCHTCHGTGKCQAGAETDCADCWHDEDAARERIEEGPLSVEVRSGWHSPGDEDAKAEEYNILLGTGGPAARIVGDLDQYGQPESAHYEFQDWFKPWTRARLSGEDEATLLEWAQTFYFGD